MVNIAQPAVGVSFKVSGLAYLDALRARRGGRWQVIVRDYDGSNTNISPGSTFGAPFAEDGTWRDDFFAIKKNATGQWIYNTAPNLGFYPMGYVDPDGIERAPEIRSDPLRGLQSLDPLRTDMTERDKTLMFTPLERNLVVDAVRFNQPLSGLLERAAGDELYFVGESTDDEPIRRQVFVMHEDKQGTQSELNAFPFPRCVLTDLGSEKGNRTDADAAKFTLSREICPYFVDAAGVPLLDGRWTSGGLWTQAVTPGLTFTATAPVGTATAATTADLVFAAVLGGSSPFTYAAESSADGLTGWTAATSTTDVTDGVVTLSITGLTAEATNYFRATVEDADSATATSPVSNAVTQPAA